MNFPYLGGNAALILGNDHGAMLFVLALQVQLDKILTLVERDVILAKSVDCLPRLAELAIVVQRLLCPDGKSGAGALRDLDFAAARFSVCEFTVACRRRRASRRRLVSGGCVDHGGQEESLSNGSRLD